MVQPLDPSWQTQGMGDLTRKRGVITTKATKRAERNFQPLLTGEGVDCSVDV